MRRQYPGLTNKDMDRLLFDYAFRTELTRKCEAAKMELSLKPEAHVLFRLRALKQIPSKSPVSKILKCLLETPQSKQARLISRIFKVNSSNGQHRAINLRLNKDVNASRGAYILILCVRGHLTHIFFTQVRRRTRSSGPPDSCFETDT